MALIRCGECGRTISDKAAACVGCGAPLARSGGLNLVPERTREPLPTRGKLIYQAVLSVLLFVLGVAGSSVLAHRVGSMDRILAVVAALLVVLGLCGIIVTGAQLVMLRR